MGREAAVAALPFCFAERSLLLRHLLRLSPSGLVPVIMASVLLPRQAMGFYSWARFAREPAPRRPRRSVGSGSRSMCLIRAVRWRISFLLLNSKLLASLSALQSLHWRESAPCGARFPPIPSFQFVSSLRCSCIIPCVHLARSAF